MTLEEFSQTHRFYTGIMYNFLLAVNEVTTSGSISTAATVGCRNTRVKLADKTDRIRHLFFAYLLLLIVPLFLVHTPLQDKCFARAFVISPVLSFFIPHCISAPPIWVLSRCFLCAQGGKCAKGSAGCRFKNK